MTTTFYRFLPTDKKGNMFIFAQRDNKVAYFFMNEKGRHLTETWPFHTEKFYKKALRTWGKEESMLPVDLYAKAEKILETHPDFKPDQKAVIAQVQVKTVDKVNPEVFRIKSAGNTMADALRSAGLS